MSSDKLVPFIAIDAPSPHHCKPFSTHLIHARSLKCTQPQMHSYIFTCSPILYPAFVVFFHFFPSHISFTQQCMNYAGGDYIQVLNGNGLDTAMMRTEGMLCGMASNAGKFKNSILSYHVTRTRFKQWQDITSPARAFDNGGRFFSNFRILRHSHARLTMVVYYVTHTRFKKRSKQTR